MENIISLENVKKSYQLGKTQIPALRGVNFSLKKGDFKAILGPSGSGKSTFLQIIATLDLPDQGKVFFKGQDLAILDENHRSDIRNKSISMIFQSFNLIPSLTVSENVYLPLSVRTDISEEEKKQRVESAIADVGLIDLKNNKPDQLSGGQRQRVAIARALVPYPDLILADEPTANLDSVSANQIIDLLLDLNSKRQMTFLFATHDEKLISRVKSLVWIKDGIIINH